MAFQGTKVPTAYQRLVRHFNAHPEYVFFDNDSLIGQIIEKAADLMDDGVENDSTVYKAPEPVSKPLTGINASIDATEFDLVDGGVQTAQITAAPVPADTTDSVAFVYSSDDEAVATVDASGVVTAVGEGSANLAVTIDGTAYSETFAVTVVDTTV